MSKDMNQIWNPEGASLLPMKLDEAAMHRFQLFCNGLNLHLPADERDAGCHHFTPWSVLADYQAKRPALSAILDTLSLAQVSVANRDAVMYHEARLRYGVALRALAYALSKQDAHEDDENLAAITLFEYCEVFIYHTVLL